MGLVNNLWGLILVYQVYTIPYCIWMLFGFLKSLPINYEEAALIDGASKNYILWKVVFPLTRTGVIATTIFSVIMAWDEFLFALLFIRTPALRTLPLVIVNFIGEYETLWGELMGIGLLTTIPILIFSSFVYKYYTKGFQWAEIMKSNITMMIHNGAGNTEINSMDYINFSCSIKPDFIEVDVRCTSDMIPVLHHDSFYLE